MHKYSVLMSVYKNDDARYFRDAVNSMLSQTEPPDDFVVVCDGSLAPEMNLEIDRFEQANSELFQIVRLPENRGLGVALSEGLKHCKYDLVVRMDSDDISVPQRVSMQMKALDETPEVSVIGGQIAEFTTDTDNPIGKRIVPLEHDEILRRAKQRNPMNHVTVMFRKPDILRCGGYVEFDKFEDYHLWTRMLAKGCKFRNIDSVCVYVRVNDNMYKRRAGVDYFKQTMKMEKFLRSSGIIGTAQMVKNCVVRLVGTVCIPNWLRKRMYQHFLRKTNGD